MFETQFAVTVDGTLVDSRMTGEIATETLMAELSTVKITGTLLTLSDTVIDIAVWMEYKSLVPIHTEAVVDISVQAEMEQVLEATMAVQLGKNE